MLIKFFPNGKGGGAGPVDYLTAKSVLAYDTNRDLIRDERGQPEMIIRDPLPEVLQGQAQGMRDLIDACPHKWSYRAGVISFAAEDAPSEEQQYDVMDRFEALAEASQYSCLWVRHSHEDRVELHFCTPRMELESGRSLNIAPPNYERAFDSLRDLMNKTHEWADPMDVSREQEMRQISESSERANGREALHDWITDQISVGLIHDRVELLETLTEAGFEIPRAGKNYVTVKDPEVNERWRLKGEVFNENWTAEATIERQAEQGLGGNTDRTRRLDAIEFRELQERFAGQCETRAAYNRGRYPQVSALERQSLERSTEQGASIDASVALDGDGERLDIDPVLTGADFFVELENGGFEHELADAELWDSADHSRGEDVSDTRPRDSDAEDLHLGGQIGDMRENQGGVDEQNTPDGAGARIAGLRRRIGESLRGFSAGIERFGKTLDRGDRGEVDYAERLRGAAVTVADVIDRSIARIVERCGELRSAGKQAAREFEISENRRGTLEDAVTLQEREDSHGLGL